jgi:hypothetical protein
MDSTYSLNEIYRFVNSINSQKIDDQSLFI